MRLDALGLVRYGHFTDRWLEFPRCPDTPDLHIIYGPNEAGKSTSFSAWLDLLFGFPHQTRYNFLHDNRALRIEARVQIGDRLRHVARIKGNSATLLDARTDQPLSDDTLIAALGGLDRAAYGTMFSLDDDTLEQGGESILSSEGNLGQLLFSATAGLAGLSAALRTVQTELDTWFHPSKRKHGLADQKSKLAEITQQIKGIDLAVSQWRALKQTHEQAQSAYLAEKSAREELQTQYDSRQRDLDALPRLRRMRSLQARLAELPAPRDLDPAWAQALPDWQNAQTQLATLHTQATQKLAALENDLMQLSDDPLAYAQLARLEPLEDRFGVIRAQQADLPKRQRELDDLNAKMRQITARLGVNAAAESLVLPLGLHAAFHDALERDALLTREAETAQSELVRAQELLVTLPSAPDLSPQAVAQLAALVIQIRRDDPLRALKEAAAQEAVAQAAQDQALDALAPWTGTADALVALDLPARASITALEMQITRASEDLRAAKADHRRLSELCARTAESLGDAAAISHNDLRTARALRNAAWATHRATLTAETADAFEQALHQDDDLADARLEQVRLAERLTRLQENRAALREATQALDATEAELRALHDKVARYWAQISPADGRNAADLLDWMSRRDTALDALEALANAKAARGATEARARQAAQSLADSVREMGRAARPDLDSLLAEADIIVQSGDAMQACARAHADVQARQTALEKVEKRRQDWATHWADLSAQTWLDTPTPTEMRAILQQLSELALLVQAAADPHHRISRIEADLIAFSQDVNDLAVRLDVKSEADVLQTWPLLRARLHAAQQNDDTRKRLRSEIKSVQSALAYIGHKEQALRQELAPVQAALNETDLRIIAQMLEQNAKAQSLTQDLASCREELAEGLRTDIQDADITRLDALDADQLRAEAESLKAMIEAQTQRLNEAYAALAEAERAVSSTGTDDQAARLNSQRHNLLLQIAQDAHDFLARQAGVIAAQSALRLYRDTHRSSMLAQASAHFAALTLGRYSALTTRPEGDATKLIAMQADGGTKPVESLSKGTRFQLYLALRAAGYLELAQTRPIMPFIADDILETFDDARAHATFKMLSEMAFKGQVIYLTHHAHLCDIARSACPSVQVIDLTAV